MRQKLVAQTLAFAGTGHQTGDVHELDRRRQDALGADDLGQFTQTGIRHFDHADVGLDGAERIVFGRNTGARQGVEESRFADVGQADDAALQSHGVP